MSKIALQLTNDLAVPVSLNVLGGVSDESNQNNADTLYEWNLSAETWVNVDTVIIQSRLSGQVVYQNSSTTLTNLSFQGVASALSTLNLGNFLVNGTIVYTYNSDIEFGDIILTLTNIPQPSIYTQLLYDHFVPSGTALRQFVYPTIQAFESDFGPAITLLIQQTNAATAIDTYGPSCIYPLLGVTAASSSFYVNLNTVSPKAPALRPILSSSLGTSQGYTFSGFPSNISNAILYFPSGDATEVNAFNTQYTQSYIFYFAPSAWSGLTNVLIQYAATKMTSQGMLNGIAITQFDYFTTNTQTYPTGWAAPALTNTSLDNMNLDAPGVQPAQTFTTSSDFTYANLLDNTVIEGYNNINFNPSGLLVSATGYYALIQYCDGVILGSNMNLVFTNVNGAISSTFDMGFTNNNVSWQNLGSNIRWNGFGTIKMDGVNLTAFPGITEMNRYQQVAPFNQFQLNLNLSSNQLSSSQVNQILIDLNQNATSSRTVFLSSTINLSAQSPAAPPSGAGLTAKNLLITKGITVITD